MRSFYWVPFFSTLATLGLVGTTQAQTYITQVVCNNINGGAIVRTNAFVPFVAAGMGLSMGTHFGATRQDLSVGVTTCLIPVANTATAIAGAPRSFNETIGLFSGAALRSVVTIDYTLGSSGIVAASLGGTGAGTNNNNRRFVFLANGLKADGSAQNKLSPGPALRISNADAVLRGNGEVRGNIELYGKGSSVLVNYNASDSSTYQDYLVELNGGIDASTATDGVTFGMMHTRLNGNFTGSNLADSATLDVGAVVVGNINAGEGNNTVVIKGNAQITGNISTGSGDDSLQAFGGAMTGSVAAGGGSDTLLLRTGFDHTGLTVIDGGAGSDALTLDGLIVRAYTSTVTPALGINLTGLETIDLVNSSVLKLTGNLFEIAAAAQLNIDATSTLDLRGNSPGVFTVYGSVNNFGVLNLQDGETNDATTITGNYHGNTGSQIRLDTFLGNDSSATDRLIVQGNLTGSSRLLVQNIGGTGAQTTQGILVVQVDGNSGPGGLLWLNSPLQVNNYEYALVQGSVSDANDWYLKSTAINAVIGADPVPIWRPAIAGYSVARSMNADVGFLQIDSLHQRMGDLTSQTIDEGKSWARLLGTQFSATGKVRFGYKQNTQGIQAGHDFNNQLVDNGQQMRTGLMLSYANTNTTAWDSVRPLVGLLSDAGQIKTDSVGFGLYHTRLSGDGAYHDWVLQANRLVNHFTDSYGGSARQKAYQIALSYEQGRPLIQMGNGWTVEGQGQVVAMHTRYQGFEDEFSQMPSQKFNALRLRLGTRLHNGAGMTQAPGFYAVASVIKDVYKTEQMTMLAKNQTLSQQVVEYFDQTVVELGIGMQRVLEGYSSIYADIRYEDGFHSRENTWKLNLGLRF